MKNPFSKHSKTTTKSIAKMCGSFMKRLHGACEERSDLILLAWSEIIGEQFAPMARAKSFKEGVLNVEVSNSSLLSILSYQEKNILLKKLREKFPKTAIKDIRFRIG